MSFRDLVADLDLAQLAVFGEPTTYASPRTGTTSTLVGIFDADYQVADAGLAGVSGFGPAVFYRVRDLPSDPDQDHPTITIRGAEYEVAEVQPDGQGGIRLRLMQVR